MTHSLRQLAIVVGLLAATTAFAADLTFYQRDDFRGRSFTATGPVENFAAVGFNDRASSLVIRSGSWEVCSDAYFRGRCVSLAPGDYATLRSMGLENSISSARPIGGRIALYDQPNFSGRGITLDTDVVNFDRLGINDRAASAIVHEGTWQLCQHADYAGACITLEPGRYADLGRMDRQASSARVVAGGAAAGSGHPRRGGGYGRASRAILYSGQNLTGREFTIDGQVIQNLGVTGFNDRAASLRVEGGYWIFCSDADFMGDCRTFGPGDYATLPRDLSNRISSGRRISRQYPYRDKPDWNAR
jgi:hypothetical protein